MTSIAHAGTVAQEPLLAQALTSTATAIFITDCNGKFVWLNDAFSKLSGYAWEDLIGHTPALLKSGRQPDTFYAQLWQTLQSGHVWQGEIVDQRKDGVLYIVDEVITPLFNACGAITHFIAIQHDITRRKAENDHDHQLAYQDFLTGLPNRASFTRCQQQAVTEAALHRKQLATLFVDLDHFKPVNDLYGHQTGDELLVAVAERLHAAVRHEDLVARIGGDEFAIVLRRLPDRGIASALAQKIIGTVSAPYAIQGRDIRIGASIGIAVYPEDGKTPATLMEHADQAMYRAKSLGGNRYQFYAAALDSACSPDIPPPTDASSSTP